MLVCGEVGAPMEHVLYLVPHLVVLQLEHILEQGHVMTQRQNMMGSNVSEVVASHRLVHPQHTVQVSICLIDLLCLNKTPLSAIFQLYHGYQF